jgi:putative DNA methylase
MRDEAEKRIGHLYPKVAVTGEMANGRPDLKLLVGEKLTVIAWLWARTVKSPNPAFAQVDVPLASSFMLSTKVGKEAYIEPVIEKGNYRFIVKMGKPNDAEQAKVGTKLSRGANFRCLMSGTPIAPDYIKNEGKAGRMGTRLMAIVAEGARGRVYLSPAQEMEVGGSEVKPKWLPEGALVNDARAFTPTLYGLEQWSDLFTPRQLVALTTLSDLVQEARAQAERDALASGMLDDGKPMVAGGTGVTAYGDAVSTYLSIGLSRLADMCNALCGWEITKTQVRHLFTRQAVPMLWDFAENNVFGEAGGAYLTSLSNMAKALEQMPASRFGMVEQSDAQTQVISNYKVVSTAPPYYDNVPYADLSDFFYAWLRPTLRSVFPDLFATVAVPKSEELVATTYRHGTKGEAENFFLTGMAQAMHRLAEQAHPAFPVTIYYAFKQAESDGGEGTVSTGWETFLDAVIRAGFATTGTWPMRTELGNRMRGMDSNALASSIVLVCRPRDTKAPTATRRDFLAALKAELPEALIHLQRGNIAPVDLAQAAIGPGMAVYTRFARVIDAEGKPLSVREALTLINETLDEALTKQEGDFDADSRWAVAWFGDHGFEEGPFGDAHTYFVRFNTAENALKSSGIIESGRGKVRLYAPAELPANWNPASDPRLTAWEVVHQLIRALEAGGEGAAATLVAKLGTKAEIARELAYRLYTVCERKKRAAEALSYNGLVQSWPEITRLAREQRPVQPAQAELFAGG